MLKILKKGGNAIDAAIATAAALTIVEPTGNGIGGDGFAILSVNNKMYGLNASGPSPKLIEAQDLLNKGLKGRNYYEKNGVLIWSIETKYWFEADSNFPEGVVKIIKLYDKGERVIDTWINEVEMSADRKQFVLLEQRQLIMIYFKSQQPTLFNFLYSFFKTEIDEYVQTGDKDKFEAILNDAAINHPFQDEEGNYIVRITLNSEVPTQSGGTTTVLNGILAELV